MLKKLFVAFVVLLSSAVLAQQSSPGLVHGQVPTAAQWNSYFASKLDYNIGGLPVIYGGTGATTRASALNNLLPAQAAHSGEVLITNGSNASWAVVTGTGTVTSTSVVTANGISGTVANPTTAPAITLSLGAITPTSISTTGEIGIGPKTGYGVASTVNGSFASYALWGYSNGNPNGFGLYGISSNPDPTIAGYALGVSGASNFAGTTSPIYLNSSAGTAGQVLTSAGPGLTPTWGAGGGGGSFPLTTDVSGGGFFIDNVKIGDATPLAGKFTTGLFSAGIGTSATNSYGLASTNNGTTTGYAVWGLNNNTASNGYAGYFATSAPTGYGYALGIRGPGDYQLGTLSFTNGGNIGVSVVDASAPAYGVASTANYSGSGTNAGYALWGLSNSPYGYGGYFATSAPTGYGYALGTNGPSLLNGNVNITGTTTLATGLTGLAKLTSGVVSAATSGVDYAPATPAGGKILYNNGSGGFSGVTIGTGLSFVAGTLSASGGGGGSGFPLTSNVDGGGFTIDNVVIGGGTPKAVNATTINSSGGIATSLANGYGLASTVTGTSASYAVWGLGSNTNANSYAGYFATAAPAGYGYALGVNGPSIFSNGNNTFSAGYTTTFNGPINITGTFGLTSVTGILVGNGTSVSSAPVTGTGNIVESSSPTISNPTISGGSLSGTISGTPNMTGFAPASGANNNSVTLPGGLQLRWGQFQITSGGGSGTIVFDVPFAHACTGILVSVASGSPVAATASSSGCNTTTATVYLANSGGTGTTGYVWWQATGY